MAKNITKKYYAIKVGKGVENKIVTTWDQCKDLVLGYSSVYKSFKTKEEAEAYLGNVNVEKVIEQTKKGIEKRKKVKATTKLVKSRISKELYDIFQNKCQEFNMSEEMVLEKLIDEWVL